MIFEVLSNPNGSVIHPGYRSDPSVREASSHDGVCVWIPYLKKSRDSESCQKLRMLSLQLVRADSQNRTLAKSNSALQPIW